MIGLEHFPFGEAALTGKNVIGGEGYLSTAEYRACYAEGRISQNKLLGALRPHGMELDFGIGDNDVP
ncbi:MAG: Na-translocating system protein MpsB [Nitrospira sp.]|nr:Na-translocating system protein MpsB [Nitrospira sp.]